LTGGRNQAFNATGPLTMNLPNTLTVSRIALTVAFLAAIFNPFPHHLTVALAIFIGAGITDYLDGAIARKRKMITNFGVLMDPLADKILTCSAFVAFVERGYVAAWMVVAIVARELAITGLRLVAASRQVVLAAEGYGKHKTITQIAAIISILVQACYIDWGRAGALVFGWPIFGVPWVHWITELLVWFAVALTFVSGALYLWRNRAIYLQDL
jgi:CDP-diacylglycerol--glycerol-3-phosphate 3-phosphatidyltransferase